MKRSITFFSIAFLLSIRLSSASAYLQVDETDFRFLLRGEVSELALSVENSSHKETVAHVRLELVDPQNNVRAVAERDQRIRPGRSQLRIPIQLSAATLKTEEQRRILWYRLRYQITSRSSDRGAVASIKGIVSLSEITPDLFELSIVKPGITAESARYRARVRAAHPISSRPVQGVSLDAELKFDAGKSDSSLKASGITDAEGFAVFDFILPRDIKNREGEIKVIGRQGGLTREVDGTIRLDRAARISINSDKTIYQPGQVMHVRALALSPAAQALAGEDLTLKIADPEETVVYRATVKTSRFGIASADWAIPDNVRLGDYDIRFDKDESDEEDVFALRYRVKISRYELPSFTVMVKPDRGYYLPGQNAEIEVGGDYLFGQPVTRGRVRLVRESGREWNFRSQKWEVEEEEKQEGELDKYGRFLARIDLRKAHLDLGESDYSRFKDISYCAYVTDLSTNRTEQRRFDLRVTKEPIHVYVIEAHRQVKGFPLEFYISTFYADGSPAQCDVVIGETAPSKAGNAVSAADEQPIARVKTNRYGVARVSGILLDESQDSKDLSLKASDPRGQTGHHVESFWLASHQIIRVDADKSLYRAGEPMVVRVTASEPEANVFIDVAQGWRVIRSEIVRLRKGHGEIILPYSEQFKDEVSFAAYFYDGDSTITSGTRTVLFPGNRDLKLNLKMSRPVYRPGQEAVADFQIQTADGQAVETALGIAVRDAAVDERARTDSEFGSQRSFYTSFEMLWGYAKSFGGVTRASLDRLDSARPFPADLQLVAEILLGRGGYFQEQTSESGYGLDQPEVFGRLIESQIKPVKDALSARYTREASYPADARQLSSTLANAGINFDKMLDPWGTPYRALYSINRDWDVLNIVTAGADKRVGTGDDFSVTVMSWPYFRASGELIDRAIHQYHKRTGGFIRDFDALRRELLEQGINLYSLKDRWGNPYSFKFDVSGTHFTLETQSKGPQSNGPQSSLEKRAFHGSAEFTVWTSKIDYFVETRGRVETALAGYFKSSGRFPEDDAELKEALLRSSIDWNSLRDPWGNNFYAVFKRRSQSSDRVTITSYSKYLEEPKQRTQITPVTQQINFVYLRSNGKDGRQATADDFDAATFSRVVAEKPVWDTGEQTRTSIIFRGASGTISGLVVDPAGAVIPGAIVKAIFKGSSFKESSRIYETESSAYGLYLLANLPVGLYEVQVSATGFASTIVDDVPVDSSKVTEVNANLRPGSVAETVMVTAAAAETHTQNATIGNISELPINGRSPVEVTTKTSAASSNPINQVSTPRLREYFPETLLWQPSLETDSEGRARLSFRLADNITTWRLAVIASTLDGRIIAAEKDVLAFQPFFVEHDPPRVLTEGDEIALPIVLRNYLDKRQSVDLELSPESWFRLLGPARKRAEVEAGSARSEVFNFRATSSIQNGKQRITAAGPEASDAVEKTVSVHPYGEEITETASQVFADSATLEVNIPENAIKGTARAALKIYPNLSAHVVESVEGIMKRPYGCAEQTISSAYPSLLVLRLYKRNAEDFPPIAQKARRYVQSGYERLLNYRDEDGGFSYWGRGEADLALTAYALRFITDAREFVAVDEGVLESARNWLVKQQRPDGSWTVRDYRAREDRSQTAVVTAYVARVLARLETASLIGDKADKDSRASGQRLATSSKRALDYLAPIVEATHDPYLIASYALGALEAGEKERAMRAISKLSALSRAESGASYWALETTTPFYGWGQAGRAEATALAVQALALSAEETSKNSVSSAANSKELLNRGLLFLLRQKDRFGVWHSTQATINVLDAIIAALSRSEPASASAPAEIIANGHRVASISMPQADRLSNPITVDVSQFISTGNNRIQIRSVTRSNKATAEGGAVRSMAQLVETYYAPWSVSAGANEAGPLRLRVGFDKTQAGVGDEITCKVEAERVASGGYGMMLAEVGLPPGAEVDRASLERAMEQSGWSFSQYDILPDKIIVYLWPQAGGTRFEFRFKPRFGINAQTAPSLVYDYYNPEARASVAPTRFTIRSREQ